MVRAGTQASREIRLASNQLVLVPRRRPMRHAIDDRADHDDREDEVEQSDSMCMVARDSYQLSFP
jgi:hypothetical protein